MADRYLTKKEILEIPESSLPLLVMSDNPYSFFGWAIRAHEKGCYNHLMWMHRPGWFASQDLVFREMPAESYAGHRLKFWTCESWNSLHRALIRALIEEDLEKPWYKRRYDLVAIFGQGINCNWLQVPWLDICSDKAGYLKKVDKRYDLKHPSPTDVNAWLEDGDQYMRGYRVFGRYVPD